MNYVALLRGINAGVKRRVPMAELRQLFTDMGFSNVKTYINSGNVIFSSDTTLDQSKVQQTLETHFGFDIDTLILSGNKICEIARQIPKDWQNDYQDHKSDVCYLFADVDSSDVLNGFKINPDVEEVRYIDGAVLSSVSRKNQPKSSLLKLVGTPLYRRMTVRNVTTARKLAELVKESV